MPLILNNVQIDNCGIGISAPKDADIRATGLKITNTKRAIELREPLGILQSLGLPATTPAAYLIEALKILEQASSLRPEQRIEKLRESRLIKSLGVAADLATIGATLLTAQTQGLISSVAEKMFR